MTKLPSQLMTMKPAGKKCKKEDVKKRRKKQKPALQMRKMQPQWPKILLSVSTALHSSSLPQPAGKKWWMMMTVNGKKMRRSARLKNVKIRNFSLRLETWGGIGQILTWDVDEDSCKDSFLSIVAAISCRASKEACNIFGLVSSSRSLSSPRSSQTSSMSSNHCQYHLVQFSLPFPGQWGPPQRACPDGLPMLYPLIFISAIKTKNQIKPDGLPILYPLILYPLIRKN